MNSLATRRIGSGPPVLVVHGGLEDGTQTWSEQMELTESWTLIIPDRVGYGQSASLGEGEDFERDAKLLAADLRDRTHIVGHSSGALAALLTAAARPTETASLTLIEPPAFQIASRSAAAKDSLSLRTTFEPSTPPRASDTLAAKPLIEAPSWTKWEYVAM